MAISASCKSCQTQFRAKDELAGKRVKCPKCGHAVQIQAIAGGAEPTANANLRQSQRRVRQAAPSVKESFASANNPLLDLLDEAGVESIPHGPICDSCGREMAPSAIVCIECGFNTATGKKLETTVYRDHGSGLVDVGTTNAERVMAKAEQEIDESPITAIGQDFGDGADSFFIAIVAGIVFAVLVALGVGTIFLMDVVTEYVSSAKISFWAAAGISVCMVLWITTVAFLSKPLHGVFCVVTAGLYCAIFGFMQGRSLLVPTIVLLVSLVIGLVSYFFAFAPPDYSRGFTLHPLG